MKYVKCILDERCSNDVVLPHQMYVNSAKFSFYVTLDPSSLEDLTTAVQPGRDWLLSEQTHFIAWLFHFEAIPVAQAISWLSRKLSGT